MSSDWDQVCDIAEGMPRAECFRRGIQMCEHANEIRARYTSLLDSSKRMTAVSHALAWCSVMEYLDGSGADVFTRQGRDEWLQTPWWQSLLGRLNLAEHYRTVSWAFRAAFGTKPVDFYTPQEEVKNDATDPIDNP